MKDAFPLEFLAGFVETEAYTPAQMWFLVGGSLLYGAIIPFRLLEFQIEDNQLFNMMWAKVAPVYQETTNAAGEKIKTVGPDFKYLALQDVDIYTGGQTVHTPWAVVAIDDVTAWGEDLGPQPEPPQKRRGS